jgi:hypothetical protein
MGKDGDMEGAIIGSGGLTGGALWHALERSGHRVVWVVRPESGTRTADNVTWDPRYATIDRADPEVSTPPCV